MPILTLRPPLRDLAGGERERRVDAETVGDLLRGLERDHPRVAGWILDERGRIRRHVCVFVNGDRSEAEARLQPDDRVQVLPSISGGATDGDGDVELLVGTRKGLFVLRGPRGERMDVAARAFAGQVVEYAVRDPRTGTAYASVTHGQFGPRLYYADDPLGEWEQANGPAFPDDVDATIERTWIVQPG